MEDQQQTEFRSTIQSDIDLLNKKMSAGSGVEWMSFWNEFRTVAGKVEGFADYIPPHKNLGAIFIKAYKIAMGEENNEF